MPLRPFRPFAFLATLTLAQPAFQAALGVLRTGPDSGSGLPQKEKSAFADLFTQYKN